MSQTDFRHYHRRGRPLAGGRLLHALVVWVAFVLPVVACDAESPRRATSASPSSAAPSGPKKITTVIRGAPQVLSVAIDSAGAGQTKGLSEVEQLVNSGLGVVDAQGELQPLLAESIPTLDNGLWRVFPDGRMETTWHLKPGAVWHDGTPFTAEDLIFTATVARDRTQAIVRDRAFDAIEALEAVNPRTLLVRWRQPYIDADKLFTNTDATDIVPMPRHLLERAYLEDPSSLLQLPYWNTEFVGTGPFKLSEWAPGSHLLLEANDRFVLGRPRIDTIEVKFIGDANVTVANILAGTIDLTLRAGLSFEQGQQIRERWASGTVEGSFSALSALFPQFLNPHPAAVADLRFRRAIVHGIDRAQLSETFQGGSPVGHSPIPPGSAEYRAVENRTVSYEYSPRTAVQLIEGMGFTRGADGLFRDSSQEVLTIKVQTTIDDLREKLILAMRDYWRQVGVEVEPVIIPRQAASDRQLRATFSSFDFTQSPSVPMRFHSTAIPLPENGFRGTNRSRYSSPELDALIDTYFVTIPPRERMEILARMIHHMTDQVVTIGIFFLIEPVAVGHRLVNFVPPRQTDGVLSWNAHEWDIRP